MDINNAIVEHLASMCEMPAKIKVISTEPIGDDALFVVFKFGTADFILDGSEQTAIYYPSDDLLFTPRDWQSSRPMTPNEVGNYEWIGSAGDEAIVMNGLPRLFTSYRDDYRKNFGRRVKEARLSKGISQADLARMSGIKQANISRIESGHYSVTLDTISRLSAVLGDLI